MRRPCWCPFQATNMAAKTRQSLAIHNFCSTEFRRVARIFRGGGGGGVRVGTEDAQL